MHSLGLDWGIVTINGGETESPRVLVSQVLSIIKLQQRPVHSLRPVLLK
jgi:hypothetical protein